MLRGVRPRNVLIQEFVGSHMNMFFLSGHHMIPRNKILWTI